MTLETNEINGWHKCSSCGEAVKPVFWGKTSEWTGFSLKQVDSGLYFKIHGGYAEFFDTVEEKDALEVLLCHTCSVIVMNIIDPKRTQKGGHHTINSDGTLCCDWAWKEDN